MRAAFKEWAVIVDALGRGEQILILRKGGISEGRGGFQMANPSFLLFPTLFHQQRESVINSAQPWYDALAPSLEKERVRIEYWVETVRWEKLESLETAQRLAGQHIWRPEVVAERFDWGRDKAIFALAVRTHRLVEPVTAPLLAEYGGCKSWIELKSEISTKGSAPVLSDSEFRGKLRSFEESLALSRAA